MFTNFSRYRGRGPHIVWISSQLPWFQEIFALLDRVRDAQLSGEGCPGRRSENNGGIESSFPIVFPLFPMVSLVSPCRMIIMLWYTLPTMWGPRSIAKLVNIIPISLWFMVLITIVTGAYKPTNIFGGPDIVNVTWTPKMAISNKKAIFGTRFQVPCWIYRT